MPKRYRRFEILLPLQFNDGTAVPAAVNLQTFEELRKRFSALSVETQKILGVWSNEGEVFRDELTKIFVDVPDTAENRRFFRDFKRVLLKRYQQLDIWLIDYSIRVN